MNLSEPFIRRPVMTTLMMFAIVLAGLMAFRALPVSDLPNVDYPVINVTAGLTGASPEVMANTVAAPLEREFMTISGLQIVRSSSSLGKTSITLEFDINKKMDAAAQDVEAAISRASARLPSGMTKKPVYFKQNPSQQPIMFFALTSETIPLTLLEEMGTNIVGKRLSMEDGVANVQVYGPKKEVNIDVDAYAMSARDLNIHDVRSSIVQANPHLPSGTLSGDIQTVTINTNGQLETIEEYGNVIIKKKDGSIIRLRDIAEVSYGPGKSSKYLRYAKGEVNQGAAILALQRLPGANSVKVSQAIHKLLPELEKELPGAVSLKLIFDKADSIRESIFDVELTLLISLILVVGIIYVYLGKGTDTIIPSLVLPMSIIGTFLIMYFMGYSIDNLSLLALTLSIGFVVDDAIVVVENIVRHVEKGEKPFVAAIRGSKEISFTVLSMTLSLSASFIPLVFMGGLVGKVFREFAVTLAAAVLVSGFVSLTLTPMLCARFLTRRHIYRKSHVARLGELLNDHLLDYYRSALKVVLKHRSAVLLCGLAALVGTVYLFKTLPMRFLPGDDIGFIFVSTQVREGLAKKQVVEHQKKVTEVLKKDPDVLELITWADSGGGQAFVKLKDVNNRDKTEKIVERINRQLYEIPGIRAFAAGIPLLDLSIGDSGTNRYKYRLKGTDFEHVAKATDQMMKAFRSTEGFQNVTSNLELKLPQINITILRDLASLYGVTAYDIENVLLDSYTGSAVTTIDLPKDSYDVTLGLKKKYQQSSRDLNRLYIRSKTTGKNIPFSSIAKWEERAGPKKIHRVDQFPSSTIAFTLPQNANLNKIFDQINGMEREILPATVTGKIEGVGQAFQETFGSLWFLVGLAIIVSYIVLGTLYESFIHPITILTTMPVAMIGGLITLWFFDQPLTLYSLVGLILLIGIVKKNGIMMVDHALEAEKDKGKSSYDAIFEACLVRFRPMMMTTLAAIMGALPIAYGIGASGTVRQPLGIVIVGGLMISQLFTLFLTPVVFLLLEKYRSKKEYHHEH